MIKRILVNQQAWAEEEEGLGEEEKGLGEEEIEGAGEEEEVEGLGDEETEPTKETTGDDTDW